MVNALSQTSVASPQFTELAEEELADMLPAGEEEEDVKLEEEATDNVVPKSPVGPTKIYAMEIEENAIEISPQEPALTANLRG